MRPRRILAAVALPGALTLVGCQSMSDIDRKIERVIAARSTALGEDAAPPRTRVKEPVPVPDSVIADEDPETTNPDARELVFSPAPDLSVEKRLERLRAFSAVADDAERVDLGDALRIAQDHAREYRTAEEEYLLAAIRLLIERHRWSPRFFDDLAVDLDAVPTGDGSYETALSIINTLGVTQRLPYGGEVSARAVVQATEQLRGAATDEFVQSSAIILSANLPIFRDAGLAAREDLIQAERDVVYAAREFERFRREFLVSIAVDYFDLLLQQANILNQEARLASISQQQERIAARVEAGREAAFQLRNVEQNVLRSQDTLVDAQERYILSLDRFKIRLGLPVAAPVRIVPIELTLDEPDVTPDEAARRATTYRLDLQNRVDFVTDARRQIEVSRNQLLPDLDLSADVILGTDPADTTPGFEYELDEAQYRAGALLSLPLDREIERLNLRASMINYNRAIRDLSQFRDQIVVEARQAVREINRARFSVTLQERSVEINELRLEELKLKEDETDAQTRLDAENELLQARNDRDAALRDLRIAILDYLLETGQMRVETDGRLKPLQGMVVRQSRVIPSVPAPVDPLPANP